MFLNVIIYNIPITASSSYNFCNSKPIITLLCIFPLNWGFLLICIFPYISSCRLSFTLTYFNNAT